MAGFWGGRGFFGAGGMSQKIGLLGGKWESVSRSKGLGNEDDCPEGETWADGYSASEYATAVMAFKPT